MFRSHLMQQFAAAARTQSRPPLALAGSSAAASSTESRSRTRTSTSNLSTQTPPRSSFPNNTCAVLYSSTSATTNTAGVSSVRESARIEPPQEHEHEILQEKDNLTTLDDKNTEEPFPTSPLLALSLQSLMRSRRTAMSFSLSPNNNFDSLKQALDRAILCAQAAPNHLKTEPFAFKRMLAPSESTLALSDIAAQVVFQKKLVTDPVHAQAHADRKREKWNQIPAFVVTLVDHQPPQQTSDDNNEPYKVLDFCPPETERQLEDYAAACAAVQNMLLSLHAEGIGTKWATGPVVRTPAFRTLVKAQETQRVVGLVMVGSPHSEHVAAVQKPRRYRKSVADLVEDL